MLRLACAVLLLGLSGCRCSTEDFQPDQATRICLTLQSCSPREFQATFGGSLEFCTTNTSPGVPMPGTIEAAPAVTTGFDQPLRDLYRCLLEAKGDCTRAGACWALSGDAGACGFPSGIASARCGGALLSGCTTDGHTFRVDCARYDAGCAYLGSYFACALDKCSGPTRCRGSSQEVCLGNALVLVDCARDGQRCEERDGGARCVSDVACARGAPGRCEGTVAIACPNGFESRTDCAANPTRKRCEQGACVETGAECSGLRGSCEGQAVEFCQDGFVRRVDCVSAGFAGCDAGACTPG